MESKALRELSALYLDSVYDEGYKPYPKEKVDKQKDKAYRKEMIARGGRKTDEKDKEADKQYERRIAMDFKTKMRKYEEEVQREEFKALTPDKKDQNNEVEIEFVNSLIESGLFSEEEIKIILWNEGYQRNPEKGEAEERKAEKSRKESGRMPPRGDKRREDFEKWYAANVR